MLIGTVHEITDMLPLTENCAGAKGFEAIQTSLVDRLDKLDSTSTMEGENMNDAVNPPMVDPHMLLLPKFLFHMVRLYLSNPELK